MAWHRDLYLKRLIYKVAYQEAVWIQYCHIFGLQLAHAIAKILQKIEFWIIVVVLYV